MADENQQEHLTPHDGSVSPADGRMPPPSTESQRILNLDIQEEKSNRKRQFQAMRGSRSTGDLVEKHEENDSAHREAYLKIRGDISKIRDQLHLMSLSPSSASSSSVTAFSSLPEVVPISSDGNLMPSPPVLPANLSLDLTPYASPTTTAENLNANLTPSAIAEVTGDLTPASLTSAAPNLTQQDKDIAMLDEQIESLTLQICTLSAVKESEVLNAKIDGLKKLVGMLISSQGRWIDSCEPSQKQLQDPQSHI